MEPTEEGQNPPIEPGIQEVVSAEPPAEALPDKTKKRSLRLPTWVSIALLVVVIGAGASAAGYYTGKQNNTDTPEPYSSPSQTTAASPTPQTTPTTSATPTPSPTATPVQDAGVTWLGSPTKIADLKLFNPSKEDAAGWSATYYKIGDLSGRDIVLAAVPGYGMGDEKSAGMFIKSSKGAYEFMSSHSPDLFNAKTGTYTYQVPLVEGIAHFTGELASIILRDRITVQGVELKAGYGFGLSDKIFFSELEASDVVNLTKFTTTPYGELYISAAKDESAVKAFSQGQAYVLKRPDGTYVQYQYQPPIMLDDMIPQVTWKDGSKNTNTFRNDFGTKCGSGSSLFVLNTDQKTSLTAAGTASDGKTVYALPDNNPAITYLYDQMEGKYFDATTNKEMEITLAEWQAKHGTFVYEDALGRLILYRNTVYGIQAECGKPVVYLYPEKTTDVSVKVGAAITVSEPTYGTGWNVTAKPDGTLTTKQGKKYSSLYWEGTGSAYPDASTFGTVVTKSDVTTTLGDQLDKLGLNAKEKSDFLEFWLPKMPNTPYVRLTWLGNKEMDALAPLTISPKPDTVIRVFLDFEGLSENKAITPQKLAIVPRKGFTVVEWGGLLVK